MANVTYFVITIDIGSRLDFTISLVDDATEAPLDLTGYTATCKIRKSYFSDIDVFTIPVVIHENPGTGVMELKMTGAETELLKPGRYVYDVEIVKDTTKIRVLEGIAVVTPNATR